MNVRTRRQAKVAVTYVGLLITLLVVLTPYIWLVLTSFKDRVDAFAIPPKIFFTPTLDNYQVAFGQKGFTQNLLNSTIVSSLSTVLALIVGVPAAYSLARFKMRGSTGFMMFLLAARMLPAIVLAVPLFILFNSVRLIDNYTALVLAYLTFNLPFAVW